MASQIKIKDESSANEWLKSVMAINEEYMSAMKEAAEALNDAQNGMDGTLVDEMVKFASSFLNAADKTFDTLNEIATTVNKVLGFAQEFSQGVVSGLAKLAGNLLGI